MQLFFAGLLFVVPYCTVCVACSRRAAQAPLPLNHACSCDAMLAAVRGSDKERTIKKSEPSRTRQSPLVSLAPLTASLFHDKNDSAHRLGWRILYWTGPDGVTGKFA